MKTLEIYTNNEGLLERVSVNHEQDVLKHTRHLLNKYGELFSFRLALPDMMKNGGKYNVPCNMTIVIK